MKTFTKVAFALIAALTLASCQQPTGGDTAAPDPVVLDQITNTSYSQVGATTYTKVSGGDYHVYEYVETHTVTTDGVMTKTYDTTPAYYLDTGVSGNTRTKNAKTITSSADTFAFNDKGIALVTDDPLSSAEFVNAYYLNGTNGTFAQTGMGAQNLVINAGEFSVYDGTAYYTAAFKSLSSGKDSLMLNDGFDDSNTANVNEGDLTWTPNAQP